MPTTDSHHPTESPATLRFGPTFSITGFASKAVASDNDADPRVVVRELIQNALDAVEQRNDGECAKVEFRLRKAPTSQLPGIEEFRRAFEASYRAHSENLAAAAHAQVERIQDALEKSTTCILEVRDNGVGLNRKRMTALLGEGRTDKTGIEGSRSAGSYGLGHFTTFAVTDLQYVLYGGIDAAGATTMSAHAVLASHQADDGTMLEPHGYFIKGHDRADISNWFVFPQDEEVPRFFAEPLSEIRGRSGSGSIILIPAFNYFRETASDFDELATLILQAATQNFFPAVHHQRLEVSVVEGDRVRSLSAGNIDEYLKDVSGSDGKRAYSEYRTMVEGREEELVTSAGSVRMYIRMAEASERVQLSIFRNGMFIAAGSNLPSQLKPYQFGGCKPFVGLLCFEPPRVGGSTNDALYEMLRTSEGEKHLNMNANRLPQNQRAAFHRCMRELHEQISNVAGPDDVEQFKPQFMLMNPILSSSGRNRPLNRQRQAQPEAEGLAEVPARMENFPVHDNDFEEGGSTGGGDGDATGDGGNGVPRPGEPKFDRRLPVQPTRPVLRALSSSRIKVAILPDEDIHNARLRLVQHSGADPSCDAGLSHSYVEFSMKGKLEGAHEVSIGTLRAGQRIIFDLDLHSPIDARDVVFVPKVISATNQHRPEGNELANEEENDGIS